jgi:hypothetical protein
VTEHLREIDEPQIQPTLRPYAPIPAVCVGFAHDRSPNETIFVQLSGFALGFALESGKVAEFGERFARMAKLPSAGGKPL